MKNWMGILVLLAVMGWLIIEGYQGYKADQANEQTLQIAANQEAVAEAAFHSARARKDCTTREPIVSLSMGDGSGSISGNESIGGRGIFLLGLGYAKITGSGSINGSFGEKDYYFYLDLGDGTYKLGNLPADTTYLKETDNPPSIVHQVNCDGGNRKTLIEIPKGSIIREFNPN